MALGFNKVQNLARLQKKLAALPKVARDRIKKAMAEVADDIVSMAKRLVSVDDGDLQRSIGWTWGDAPPGSMTLATVAGLGGAKDLTITIYAGDSVAFYARWVEFGTAPHSLAKGADSSRNKRQGTGLKHPGSTKKPFFYVSYRSNRRRGKAKISRAINRAGKDVAAGKT